jgi:hypothetical protein
MVPTKVSSCEGLGGCGKGGDSGSDAASGFDVDVVGNGGVDSFVRAWAVCVFPDFDAA